MSNTDYKHQLIQLQIAARALACEADEWLNDTLEANAEKLEQAIIDVERLTQGEKHIRPTSDDNGKRVQS